MQSKDSLSYFLEKSYDDNIPVEKKKVYTEKALSIISQQKNDSSYRRNLFKIANRYFYLDDNKNYKKITEKIITASLFAKDSSSVAKAYTYLGDYYTNVFISDSAYDYHFKAEKLYLLQKNYLEASKSILSKSILQLNEKDYVGSEKSVFEAIKYLKKIKDDLLLYQAYNLLGVIYNELNEFDKAIEYDNKALDIIINNPAPEYSILLPSSYNNIGLVYQNNKNHKKAIQYFNRGLEFKDLKSNNPTAYTYLRNNLGYSKLQINDLTNIPNLFNENLKLADSLKIIPSIISSKMHLSEYYALEKDTITSKKILLEAYNLSKKSGISRDILSSLKQLSKIDKTNGVRYSDEYIHINDSLQLTERQTRNKLARIEFETDEIITQKNQLVEQRKTIIYISLGIMLLGVFIFIIRFQAAKNRELKLVQEQQKANEEIYHLMLNQQSKIEEVRQLEKKRIAQELHDGVLGKLFGTRMNLGVLNNKDGEKAKSERVVYIDELQSLEQEIREISHDLNSEKTAVFNNFVLMVSNFIETQKKVCKAEIGFSVDASIEWNNVDNMAKINFYRILQEAFQNINKHANAKHVTVAFTKTGEQIRLDIKDDGVGFNYAKKKNGIGLINMNSRITDSGGNMQVVTAPGEGTLLKFDIPS